MIELSPFAVVLLTIGAIWGVVRVWCELVKPHPKRWEGR